MTLEGVEGVGGIGAPGAMPPGGNVGGAPKIEKAPDHTRSEGTSKTTSGGSVLKSLQEGIDKMISSAKAALSVAGFYLKVATVLVCIVLEIDPPNFEEDVSSDRRTTEAPPKKKPSLEEQIQTGRVQTEPKNEAVKLHAPTMSLEELMAARKAAKEGPQLGEGEWSFKKLDEAPTDGMRFESAASNASGFEPKWAKLNIEGKEFFLKGAKEQIDGVQKVIEKTPGGVLGVESKARDQIEAIWPQIKGSSLWPKK